MSDETKQQATTSQEQQGMGDLELQEPQVSNNAPVVAPSEEPANIDAATPAPTTAIQQQAANQPGSVVNPNIAGGGFRIHRAADRTRYLKALIYGEPGVGKTFLTGTAADVPSMRDVLVISAESGDMSISDRDVDVIPISNFKQMARIYEYLRVHVAAREAGDLKKLATLQKRFMGLPDDTPMKKEDVRQYRTVVIDSLSEIQKYCMYQLLGVNANTKLDDEPTPAQFKEWGQAGEMIRLLVRNFRDLDIHVIFVSGIKQKEDEAKRTHYSPNFPGGLAIDVMGFVDLVGFYRNAIDNSNPQQPQRVRRLYIAPGITFAAKSRLRSLDGITQLDNPSMADLVKGLVK